MCKEGDRSRVEQKEVELWCRPNGSLQEDFCCSNGTSLLSWVWPEWPRFIPHICHHQTLAPWEGVSSARCLSVQRQFMNGLPAESSWLTALPVDEVVSPSLKKCPGATFSTTVTYKVQPNANIFFYIVTIWIKHCMFSFKLNHDDFPNKQYCT